MITTATILVIWQLVAVQSGTPRHGWVYMGEYHSTQSCKEAARQLAVDHFRCLPK